MASRTTLAGRERVLVLVKAVPHAGERQGETVCCAGVTATGEWRRQYPIHFRRLRDNKFKRWQWIEYDYMLPQGDKRTESRRVQEDTIELGDTMPSGKRAGFLDRVIVPSVEVAAARNQSLALIRPVHMRFHWIAKRLFDNSLKPLRGRDSSCGCGTQRRATEWWPSRRRRSGTRAT
jgi:hypothetical protein